MIGKLFSPRSGLLGDIVNGAIYTAFMAALLFAACALCPAAERLDVSILDRLDAPAATATTAAPDALDCSILAALDAPATTAPRQILDVSILSALDGDKPTTTTPNPATKPRVKPSRAALDALRRTVDVGDEVGSMCRPQASAATVTDYSYPTRSGLWTHPGNIRSHVMQGQHAGKLTADQVAKMSTAELEAWHSDDHEGRATTPVKVIATVPDWGGYSEFIWLDGSRHPTPQPGAYYPTFGRVLVPASATIQPTQQAPQSQPVRYQAGGCPGGVCPVQAPPSRLFKFRG